MNQNIPELEIKKLHPVHSVYDGVFNAYPSGNLINLSDPDPATIEIQDIANALANLCRFGGHVKRYYSVAQHSVLVAALAPEDIKKEALLHDAAEAYLNDVIKPFKVMIEHAYEPFENLFMQVIIHRFGLNPLNFFKVKKYDLQALELEREYLQNDNVVPLNAAMRSVGLVYSNVSQWSWAPELAKHVFLSFYKRYFFKF